ncbi:transcriptional repressor [Pseudonocardia sulfidoxydans NBRC 16205]|uniref:Transcriptional repressor n=1 Tax=Pseudonocardia sulfidoxydans NBRC 16205 TaxID=1223511 RepID=A0A511DFS4_9PSEU|nr:Fur family transcriptional regulator [Pseudonocardia sulfidoxydans]GEL21838.1 transcriptional repressor [Pseudonocardia sulfidoxydans NBRC 16205]
MDVRRAAGLSSRLRSGGLRATGPRVEVLGALEDLGGHRTADEVHDLLTTRGRRVPRSSVYNALSSLVGAGLALTADAGPGAVLYETGREWHHHFVCRVCHRVIDVACAADAMPCLNPDPSVGEVEEAQVVLRGTCAACLAGGRPHGARRVTNP